MFTLPVPTAAWIVVAIIVVIFAVVFILLLMPMMALRIMVTPEEVKVSAPPLYWFKAKRTDIVEAMVVDRRVTDWLNPTLRLYGHGLPGYKLGWFKLKNGAKAFMAVDGGDRAVVFRLRDGSYLVLAPKEFERFISVLEKLGWLKS